MEYLQGNAGFADSEVLCREKGFPHAFPRAVLLAGWDHEALVGAIKSLQAEDCLRAKGLKRKKWDCRSRSQPSR